LREYDRPHRRCSIRSPQHARVAGTPFPNPGYLHFFAKTSPPRALIQRNRPASTASRSYHRSDAGFSLHRSRNHDANWLLRRCFRKTKDPGRHATFFSPAYFLLLRRPPPYDIKIFAATWRRKAPGASGAIVSPPPTDTSPKLRSGYPILPAGSSDSLSTSPCCRNFLASRSDPPPLSPLVILVRSSHSTPISEYRGTALLVLLRRFADPAVLGGVGRRRDDQVRSPPPSRPSVYCAAPFPRFSSLCHRRFSSTI